MENSVEFKNRASKPQLVGFAGNNAATNALFVILSSFFLVYATTVYGYSALLVGGLMTATRLFDAVTDPIIGIMVDKTNTKLGRFRPWIIAGSLLSNAMFLVLFAGIDLGSSGLNLAFLIAVYVVWVLGYTFQTSISKAGQNVLTSDPKQRTSLNAISGIFTMVVFVTALTIFPRFMGADNEFAADPASWQKLALVMVIIQAILTLAAVSGIWKKDVPENYEIGTVMEKPKAKDYIDLFKNNKALQMLIVAASTNKIAYSMSGGMIVFFYAYVALNPALQGVVTPTSIIFMLLATITALIYTNKVGRKKSFKNLSFLAMVYSFLAIALIAIESSSSIWLILVLGIYVFFQGSTDLNVIPMIGDAADYENYQRGRFIPGMIGTSFSLIDKIVSSLSTTFVGLLLTILGYVSITETEPTPMLFWGILIVYFGVPALGHLASVIAMKYYPIDNELMNKMHVELQARRNNK
jgi:Na+/melibiose symporter-like transporter